jgi:hypothetical protein
MTNEEFQKIVLQELKEMKSKIGNLETGQDEVGKRLSKMETGQDEIGKRLLKMETGQDEIKTNLSDMKTRQDEIYQVVSAIEHSNQVGKSELDSHNIRIAKVEGKLKKVAKAFNEEEELDEASNL